MPFEKKESTVTVQRAEVKHEPVSKDRTYVSGKEDDKRYLIGHFGEGWEEEMNAIASAGYAPARGKERMMTNPFMGDVDQGDGKTKTRGDRMLYCCPMKDYKARQQEELVKQQTANKRNRADADKMNRDLRGKGVHVESEGRDDDLRA